MIHKTKALHIVYFMLFAVMASMFIITYNTSKELHTQAVQSIMPQKSPINQIIEAIEKLPESALKSNLYIIIGTEYAGDGEALNKVLQEWSRLQVDQLQKRGKMSL